MTALLCCALFAGCAAPAPEPSPVDAPRPMSALGAAFSADNGLEIRRWVFADDPLLAAMTLGRVGRDAIDDDTLRDRLERNGFRLRLLSEPELDETLDRLGEPLTDVRTWHGQATQWRELSRRPVGPSLATIVDGRARTFSGGAMRLLLRGWTLPMEDGLRLTVECVPHFDPLSRGGYRALMGSEAARGERFDFLGVELQLRAGEILLVTGESPTRSWSLAGGDLIDEPATAAGDRPDEATVTDRADRAGGWGVSEERRRADDARDLDRASSGRSADFGPPAVVPLTLGELLLTGDAPPVRTVLIVIPRLPEIRYGSDAPVAGAVDRTGSRDAAGDAVEVAAATSTAHRSEPHR